MIVRLIYDPSNTYRVHRYDVQADNLNDAMDEIDAPDQFQEGDVVVVGNYKFFQNTRYGMTQIEPLALHRNPKNCTLCDMHKDVINVGVQADVRMKDPPILILGMAPGREEDIEARPFVESAPAGGLMRRLVYDSVGIPPEEVAWTNIAKCFPTMNGAMRDPSFDEMFECAGAFLWQEIVDINPKVIVALGATTVNFLLRINEKITAIRGRVYEVVIGGKTFKVIPCIHPSAVARGRREWEGLIVRDVRAAYKLATVGDEVLPAWDLVNDTETALGVIKKIKDFYRAGHIRAVALDIETDSRLAFEEDEYIVDFSMFEPGFDIMGIGLSWDPDFGVFIPIGHKDSKIDRLLVTSALRSLLEEVPLICHNGKFDQSWLLSKLGIESRLLFDTMLGSYALFGHTRRHGLKGLLTEFYGWPPYEAKLAEAMMLLPTADRRYSNANLTMLAQYCSYDVIGTYRLFEKFDPMLDEQKCRQIFEVLVGASDLFKEIEVRGAAIDLNRLQHYEGEYPKMIANEDSQLLAINPVARFVSDRGKFNYRSPNDLRDLMYGYSQCTKCGADSRSKDYYQITGRTFFNTCPTCHSTEGVHVSRYLDFPPPVFFKCHHCRASVPVKLGQGGVNLYEVHGCRGDNELATGEIIDYGATSTGMPSVKEAFQYALIQRYSHRHFDPKQIDSTEFACECCGIVPRDGLIHPIPGYEQGLHFLMTLRRTRKMGKITSYFESIQSYIRPSSISTEKKLGTLVYNHLLHYTKTGRVATREYSMHTVPWKSDVRRLVVSKWIREGGLILSADYSQLELRIMACLSKDPALIQAFVEKKDIHRVVASRVWKLPENQVSDAQRRFSKTISFGIIYGRGAESIAEESKMPVGEAREVIDKFLYEEFKGVGDYIEGVHTDVQRDGFVKNPLGRTFFLNEVFSDEKGERSAALRQSQNYPIQSTASDINLMSAISANAEYKKDNLQTYVWGVIHDAIENATYPGEFMNVLNRLDRIMAKDVPGSLPWVLVPLVAEFEISSRWDGGCKITEFGPDYIKVKGPDRFFNETVEVAKRGHNLRVEITKKKPREKVEEVVLRRSYEGDDGGENEIEAILGFV